MSLELNKSVVLMLTHQIPEIRQQSLEHIATKVNQALTHNHDIQFKLEELFSQLIRWFSYKPIVNANKVLQLIATILESPKGRQAAEKWGIKRFIREIRKVKQFLNDQTEVTALWDQVMGHLQKFEQEIEMEKLVTLSDKLSIDADCSTTTLMDINLARCKAFGENEFEQSWSRPATADYNSMKFFAELLVHDESTVDELQCALQRLQITMIDYPAEYVLQAPHIFLSLRNLYERHDEVNCPLEEIICTFGNFMQILKKRIVARHRTITYAPMSCGSSVMPSTQIKLATALDMQMVICVTYLEMYIHELRNETEKVFALFYMCLDICCMQNIIVNGSLVNRLWHLVKRLKENIDKDQHFTLQRINYLLLLFLLQRIYEVDNELGGKLDSTCMNVMLYDYPLRAFYPNRIKNLQDLLFSHYNVNNETLQKYEQEFTIAIKLLSETSTLAPMDILAKSEGLHLSLELFNSDKLIILLLDSIKGCLPQMYVNEELRGKAMVLLLKLLSLPDEKMSALAYRHVAQAFKRHFACLMNGEVYAAGVDNRKILERHIIGVPLNTRLLMKIIGDGIESSNAIIKQSSEDIAALLLRSYYLLNEYWSNLLEILVQVMPLLQCYTSSTKVTQSLLTLLDPDSGHLPFNAMLKGNIRFLYSKDATIRTEALTRIVYILNSMENASVFVPNVLEISDLLPNDICIFTTARDFSTVFGANMVAHDDNTLNNLLTILDTDDIEPLIRKTTFMQLNIFCQNWDMCKNFGEHGAYFLVLHCFECSLKKNSYHYPECVIPAAGIIAKLLLCDTGFREELSNIDNIYILLLRTLMLYCENTQLRHDVSLALFTLLFSSYVVVTPQCIRVPRLMNNLCLPLRCVPMNDDFGTPAADNFTAIFMNAEQRATYLRHFVAATFCDGLANVQRPWLDEQKAYNLSPCLNLTQHDYRLINATNAVHNLRRFLRAIDNATDYGVLASATIPLKLQLILNDLQSVPVDTVIEMDLFNYLNKYIHQLVTNNSGVDLAFYEELLELCELCFQRRFTIVSEGISKVVKGNMKHAFLQLLRNAKTPFRLYQKVCKILVFLINTDDANNFLGYYTNLFEYFFEVMKDMFDNRDLQRVRCLLSLLQHLSAKHLTLFDEKLFDYSTRCLNFSIVLKPIVQTGAQLQRDSLQITCQLIEQMVEPERVFILSDYVVKYLSGLCGHNDYQVRALAWCVLAKVALYKMPQGNGCTILSEVLSYLPGGFIACCLSTMLDNYEVILVRQLAGHMFADLMLKCHRYDQIIQILEEHDFWRVTCDSLNLLDRREILPKDYNFAANSHLVTCEIVSCFIKIYIGVIQAHEKFVMEMCEKAFTYKLYEVIKVSDYEVNKPAFLTMCGDIAQIYALISNVNLEFLQCTMCHDLAWIKSFCRLLNAPFGDAKDHVNVLQLLMIICKDERGFRNVCESIKESPRDVIQLFTDTLTIEKMNTTLQRCVLAVISFLLIKSQLTKEYEHITFAEILETYTDTIKVSPSYESDKYTIESKMSKVISIFKGNLQKSIKDDNTTTTTAPTTPTAITNKNNVQNSSTEIVPAGIVGDRDVYQVTAAELIFVQLYRLFNELYPTSKGGHGGRYVCSPNGNRVKICETLTTMLKVSQSSRDVACSLKLFDNIIKIFNTIFDEFNASNAAISRRFSDIKRNAVIRHMELLCNIILNWFSDRTVILINDDHGRAICKVVIKLWPWLLPTSKLKLLVLQMSAILSEHSMVVCKHLTSTFNSSSESVVQLVIKMVTCETSKVKANNTQDVPEISLGLRILINCCTYPEGRTPLMKIQILSVFDTMYPFNNKAPVLRNNIFQNWLEFWEVFSRYPEGASARNVSCLCKLVITSKENNPKRILSLKILRNMCFINSNRAILTSSADFMHVANEILSKNHASNYMINFEEQMVMSVAIWKLLSGGAKFVALLRGTNLSTRLKDLYDYLRTLKERTEEQESKITMRFDDMPYAESLHNVLQIVMKIFDE